MIIPLEEGTEVRMHEKRHIISCGIVYMVVILNQSHLIAELVGLITVAATVPTSMRMERLISVI